MCPKSHRNAKNYYRKMPIQTPGEQLLPLPTGAPIEEYILEYYGSIAEGLGNSPSASVEIINQRYANIRLPQEERESFLIHNPSEAVTLPLLYGLNAREALDEAGILLFHTYPYGELRGRGVVVGIIDTGIDYPNSVFRYEDGTTRIQRIWDQSIEGSPPTGFKYGTEYMKEQINEALASPDPYSVVPSRDENGHGTVIAGIAAGYDRSGANEYTGGAPDAELYIVKLRPASEYLRQYYFIKDGAYACQSNDIMLGVRYLIQSIRETEKPMVICLAIGTNDGAHDGSNILESVLQEISALRDIALVISAGNEANTGHHYSGTLVGRPSDSFEVNVAEGEEGFELIVWSRNPDKISISIRSPIGTIIEKIPVTPGGFERIKLPLEETVVTVLYQYPDPRNGAEEITVRLDKPTNGIWTFTVYGDYVVDGRYDAWLPKDGFLDSGTRFLQPDPFITLTIPATMSDSIVVGAYDNIDKSMFAGSSRGPTRAEIIKPDLIAPGVNVRAPQVGGGYTSYTGTGASAAVTAAAAALLFQWGLIEGNLPFMNTNTIRAILIRGATRQKGVVYPNPVEGYGRLNLLSSLALL
ncbi:MAG TPA: S8 family peptidase [Epulopiscium sp.]|nr:S8 family peptidase [Candidatus Epulonipiscium sp.]